MRLYISIMFKNIRMVMARNLDARSGSLPIRL